MDATRDPNNPDQISLIFAEGERDIFNDALLKALFKIAMDESPLDDIQRRTSTVADQLLTSTYRKTPQINKVSRNILSIFEQAVANYAPSVPDTQSNNLDRLALDLRNAGRLLPTETPPYDPFIKAAFDEIVADF